MVSLLRWAVRIALFYLVCMAVTIFVLIELAVHA